MEKSYKMQQTSLYLDLIIQVLLFVLFLFIVCFSLLLPQTHSGPTFVHLKRKRKSIYISDFKLQKKLIKSHGSCYLSLVFAFCILFRLAPPSFPFDILSSPFFFRYTFTLHIHLKFLKMHYNLKISRAYFFLLVLIVNLTINSLFNQINIQLHLVGIEIQSLHFLST